MEEKKPAFPVFSEKHPVSNGISQGKRPPAPPIPHSLSEQRRYELQSNARREAATRTYGAAYGHKATDERFDSADEFLAAAAIGALMSNHEPAQSFGGGTGGGGGASRAYEESPSFSPVESFSHSRAYDDSPSFSSSDSSSSFDSGSDD